MGNQGDGRTPATVRSLWIGNRLPPLQQLSVRSFLAHGHRYELYAYDEIDSVPEGTSLCDATAILPREDIFCYQHGFGKGSYSAFSNVFRYKLVFEKGGWWVDTDLICLKTFDFDNSLVFATERENDGTLLTATCAFRSPAGSPHLRYCLDICDAKDKAQLQWSEIGPYLFDDAIQRFGLTAHCVGSEVFNPVDFGDFRDILAPTFEASRLTRSYGLHLWHEMWRSHGFDADPRLYPNSLYATLWRQHVEEAAAG